MRQLLAEQLTQVAGGELTMSYDHKSTHYHYDMPAVTFTLQYDGSIPPEFQTMIDDGASFHDMQPYLMIYQVVLNATKAQYPDLFTC